MKQVQFLFHLVAQFPFAIHFEFLNSTFKNINYIYNCEKRIRVPNLTFKVYKPWVPLWIKVIDEFEDFSKESINVK